ncbi:hypothetical protein MIND_00920300 [Mycena indigotica]|uniref:Thioesterase domain-containing protein n=1 Tax=Mycena indigotica TaxID=2126181 RepID=A0A8H6SC90_9AGAR|nr:uncharacterized protein MIND_00920300 [Mycena indigotica]KAF7296885.1 hypothetical protein MIND_00920300 [Mycena indigotica]
MADAARLQKLLSRIPQVDASHVQGNLPTADKQVIASIFRFFITGGATPSAFARSVGERSEVVEMNIFENPERAEVVLEVEVTQDMCNAFGTLHGACGAFLLDHATLGTFVLLGRVKAFDGVGMTTTMNLHWHTPATAGEVITIRASTLFVDRRQRGARVARCEIREKTTGRLVVSGTTGGANSGGKL